MLKNKLFDIFLVLIISLGLNHYALGSNESTKPVEQTLAVQTGKIDKVELESGVIVINGKKYALDHNAQTVNANNQLLDTTHLEAGQQIEFTTSALSADNTSGSSEAIVSIKLLSKLKNESFYH